MLSTILATSVKDACESRFHKALIDVRPLSDYTVGHLPNAFNLKLSSILLRRYTLGKLPLCDLIIEEQRDLFKSKLAEGAQIVFYDDNTVNMMTCDTKSTLAMVLSVAVKTYKDASFLEGGYAAYCALYPQGVSGQIAFDSVVPVCLPSRASTHTIDLALKSPDRPFMDRTPSCVLPHVFVGSQAHAQQKPLLDELGITHIVNITATCPNWHEGSITYKNIPIKDTWNQRISSFFDEAFEFIEAAKDNGGRVLVHCVAGISRSPTFVIAYLMYAQRFSLELAIDVVKRCRTIISPNLDFLVELQRYERHLFTSSPDEVGEVPSDSFYDCPISPSSDTRAMSLCASINRGSFSALRMAEAVVEQPLFCTSCNFGVSFLSLTSLTHSLSLPLTLSLNLSSISLLSWMSED